GLPARTHPGSRRLRLERPSQNARAGPCALRTGGARGPVAGIVGPTRPCGWPVRAAGRLRQGALSVLGLGLMVCGGGSSPSSAPPRDETGDLLRTTWTAYVRSFIQGDGRVIDSRSGGNSTSEGQAYAMLRAVWMDDRVVFDKALTWALNNLNHGV